MRASYKSPVGGLHICMDDDGCVTALSWNEKVLPPIKHTSMDRLIEELDQYFKGSLTSFSTCVRPEGTDFEQNVWALLREIPYATTVSYQDIANQLGDPKAIRAVGGANGRNKIPILIPCHRVIGSDGSLTGFSGGLDKKIWLLEHEGAIAKQLSVF